MRKFQLSRLVTLMTLALMVTQSYGFNFFKSYKSRSLSRSSSPSPSVDGSWTSWGPWGSCSNTCGFGGIYRYRTCTNPAPVGNGQKCIGRPYDYALCNIKWSASCCVRGNWVDWGSWGMCSTKCGAGTYIRKRTCTKWTYCGRPCAGMNYDVGRCNENVPCNYDRCVDGMWAKWGRWGGCSTTCGLGTRTRTRDCCNPPPSRCGHDCQGDPLRIDKEKCNENVPCTPTGCEEWTSWTSCSSTCGFSQQTRYRVCEVMFDGKYCSQQPCSLPDGDQTQRRQCVQTGVTLPDCNGGVSGIRVPFFEVGDTRTTGQNWYTTFTLTASIADITPPGDYKNDVNILIGTAVKCGVSNINEVGNCDDPAPSLWPAENACGCFHRYGDTYSLYIKRMADRADNGKDIKAMLNGALLGVNVIETSIVTVPTAEENPECQVYEANGPWNAEEDIIIVDINELNYIH